MVKHLASLILLCVSVSSLSQTDAQLEQLRTEVRKSGIEALLIQMAQQGLSVVRSQNTSADFEIMEITATGSILTTIWRARSAEYKDVGKDIELQAKSHTMKTVCSQRVRGMLIQEFGATMLSRYVDKNDRFMWEVRVDRETCKLVR